MSSVGRRVSIASTSPPAAATVSVWTRGALSPTAGTLSLPGATTWICCAAATGFPSTSVTASTEYAPGRPSGTSAAYTAANGSPSVAACWER